HPLNTAVLTSFLSGTSLLILSRFIGHVPKIPSSNHHKYSAIPLADHDQSPTELLSPISVPGDFAPTKARIPSRWLKVGVLAALGCVRIALYRSITLNIECAPTGYEWLIPFVIALYDFWRTQRSRPVQTWIAPDRPQNPRLRFLVATASRIHFWAFQSRFRYILSAAFLAASGLLVSSFHDGRQSSYICPILSGQHLRQRIFKIFNLILDSITLIGAAELSGEGARPREGRRKQTLVSWGYTLLGVTAFWAILTVYLTTRSTDDTFVTLDYVRSAVSQAVLVTIVIVSASQLVSYYGMVGICVLAGFILTYCDWTSAIFNAQEPFPLIFASRAFAALFLSFLGGVTFLYARTVSEDEPPFLCRFNSVIRFLFTLMFGIGLIWVFNQPSEGHVHPIDLLIYEGKQKHDIWRSGAKGSGNLEEAIQVYQSKYNQLPPPGFDIWYEYAINRSSVVIDDFDQIYADLLPFRALAPAKIRSLTQQLATNPFNDIGALSIRNGSVRVQEGIKPTHAWMVLGAAQIIEKFSQYLPDMDLAFNLNDEPRVAVPWEKLAALKNQAETQRFPPSKYNSAHIDWSPDRDETWAPLEPPDRTTHTVFIDSSFKNIFDQYVRPTCPPGSKARSQRIWDKRNLCLSCIRPHSMGHFTKDWKVATDICHQPDLATLSGFFLSPASFRVTQELVPVFSQSSISGFNDIIFPSPWNYVDKISYQPNDNHPDRDYSDKGNDIHDGRWKGMPRQRLAHFVNNNTYNHISVLLPASKPDNYAYQIFPGRAPSETLGLNASVSITDITRCWVEDCNDQKAELGAGTPVDFQSHWQHRYLFDSDGAGFSGRFLPFLQSHSLPFKTGLFRQWFDARVTPWLHYAPIDIRLHGLWSTLAYFAGVDVRLPSQRRIKMQPHDLQGRWIAEEGRKWAQTALRKEDMEIYFFRLLLEWGRLTDDRRDLLGFTPS
ncbi:hypothetical protein ARAM_006505, partial [Aspergillus rambellii]